MHAACASVNATRAVGTSHPGVRISLLHAVACDMLLRAPKLRPHPLDDEAREDTAQHQFHNSSESPTRSEPEPEPEPAEQVLPESRSDQQAVHEGIPKSKGSLADIPHEIMARVCTWLPACDLARLACVSRRLAEHAKEAGKRMLAACTLKERTWIAAEEQCGLGQLHEVETLRKPPRFVRAHASMVVGAGGTEVFQDPARRSPQAARSWSSSARAAACGAVMRRGTHYTEFVMVRGTDLMVGVVRSSWDVKGSAFAHGTRTYAYDFLFLSTFIVEMRGYHPRWPHKYVAYRKRNSNIIFSPAKCTPLFVSRRGGKLLLLGC
jgi:hypothetical protein